MTATTILMQRQAIALKRAAELAEALDPLSDTLRLVMDEPNPGEVYVLAEVAATLAKICVQQRQHITELAERVEALEVRAPTK